MILRVWHSRDCGCMWLMFSKHSVIAVITTLNYSQKNLLPKDVKMLCNPLIEWLKKISERKLQSLLKDTESVTQKGWRVGKVTSDCYGLLKLKGTLKIITFSGAQSCTRLQGVGVGCGSVGGDVCSLSFTFTPHLLTQPE